LQNFMPENGIRNHTEGIHNYDNATLEDDLECIANGAICFE